MSTVFGLLKIYAFALISSLLLVALVASNKGLAGVITVLILAGVEITFSFDNAVINARVLKKQSEFWQKMFMTVGIVIAVFGVRFLLPLAIVAVTAGLGFWQVADMALNHPSEYAEHLEKAKPLIAAFGGTFLLMVFLDFVLTDRSIKWIETIEKPLIKLGRLKNVSVTLALLVLIYVTFWLAPQAEQESVMVAGIIGLLAYLLINTLDSLAEPGGGRKHGSIPVKTTIKAGLIGFFYLQLIDASFSLDGVIGAFAITQDVLLIAAGLGIGALFVRSMTVHLLKGGVLDRFRYIEHGAHYAIGILAFVLLVSVRHEIPEIVSGLSGLAVIVFAFVDSMIENKRHGAAHPTA